MKLILLPILIASGAWAKPESGNEWGYQTPITCVEVIELIKSATADGKLFNLRDFSIIDEDDDFKCPTEPHLEINRTRYRMIKTFQSCPIL